LGIGVWGLRFGVWGLGIGDWGLGIGENYFLISLIPLISLISPYPQSLVPSDALSLPKCP